jgi:hypothetical protein
MWVKWKLISVCLEIVLILMHLMELLGDMGELEAHFGPFGNSVNQSAR